MAVKKEEAALPQVDRDETSLEAMQPPANAPVDEKREAFLDEFASTDARRVRMRHAIDAGMDEEEFVHEFKLPNARYVVGRLKKVRQ